MVQLALKRPYTFIVMAMLIVLATPFALRNMATDIFPEINIPVISIIWNYGGLPATEMGQRIAAQNERSLTTTVSDIEHIESTSLAGITVIKVFFQPNANIQTAIAQVVAIEQTQLRQLPPGITPPLIIKYSASSIPVIQLGLSSPTLPEQTLFDTGITTLRPQLVTIPGVAVPFPYGGKNRVISVDLDMQALQARGLAPADVVNAINLQNLILPSGTAKFGGTEYTVRMNGSPEAIAGLNDLPVRSANGTTTYLRDVAYVRDGFTPQTNIVRQDGTRGVLLSVLKNGGASTLDIVADLKALLPRVQEILPGDIKVTPLFDQSVFVKAAVEGVVVEALIAAGLTALMVLLFLGNWRSTLIIALTIPLSILASILALQALGETLNLMTLGGLALVGRHPRRPGHRRRSRTSSATCTSARRSKTAIVVGAGEIGVPAFVSTLCICIVFVPMFFLSGRRALPLRAAGRGRRVRDDRLLHPVAHAGADAGDAADAPTRTAPRRRRVGRAPLQRAVPRVRRALRARAPRLHAGCSPPCCAQRGAFGIAFLALLRPLVRLYPVLGRDFFPSVDAGQIRLHMRAPTGTRIEETARLADEVEAVDPRARAEGPARDHPRQPRRAEQRHQPVVQQRRHHRHARRRDPALAAGRGPPPDRGVRHRCCAPSCRSAFRASSSSSSRPTSSPRSSTSACRRRSTCSSRATTWRPTPRSPPSWRSAIREIPGAVDAHVHQRFDAPAVSLQMDRTRLQQMGLTAQNVGQNVLISLSGSSQTAPAFWLNPQNGVVYQIAVQTPQYRVDSLDALLNVPVAATGSGAQSPRRRSCSAIWSRRHPHGRPPWSRATTCCRRSTSTSACRAPTWRASRRSVQELVDEIRPKLPRGSQVTLRGQVQTMQASFIGLGVGLAMAIVLVYLLVVVNFQSWIDAFIIIAALPAALAGIAWMLFITGTTLSVPALTGAIMTMGVATANSILLVSFARAAARRGRLALAGGARRRGDAHPAGADDGAGDDHRHDPDGARHRRRRRAERAARPRGDRRPGLRDGVDAALRAGGLRRHPRPAGAAPAATRRAPRRADPPAAGRLNR